MAAMRALVEPNKGKLRGTAARGPFDGLMERVAPPEGITYELDTVGSISGWWCRPEAARPECVTMHIRGGWFNWAPRRPFVTWRVTLRQHWCSRLLTRLSARTGASVPCCHGRRAELLLGLAERGFSKIAVTGDSAGGNLALELLVHLAASSDARSEALVGAVALSPVTDLTLSGRSWSTRAVTDPYFVQPQAAELVGSYLAGHDAGDPLASPLYADLTGVAPIRVHVGNEEVLLDDSVRFVERAVAAGVDAQLDVWEGMVHGFLGSVGRLEASRDALQLVRQFLASRFA